MSKKLKLKKSILIVLIIIFVIAVLTAGISALIINFLVPKCSDGYTFDGKRCKKTITEKANTITTCKKDYVLEGSDCIKIDIIEPTKSYNCDGIEFDDQYTYSTPVLDGEQCRYEVSHEATEQASCVKNCYLSKEDECTCRTEHRAYSYGNKYTCPIGQTLEGDKCVITTTMKPIKKKVCVEGFKMYGTTCKKNDYKPANVILNCDNGYTLNVENKCEKKDSLSPHKEYVCPKGYTLKNKSCNKDIFKDK